MDHAMPPNKAQPETNNNQYLGGYKNGFALFGYSVLCNSFDTWSIGSTWCRYIDGYCQMANNSIHYPGGNIAHIWRLIPHAWNLGLRIPCPEHIIDNAQGNR